MKFYLISDCVANTDMPSVASTLADAHSVAKADYDRSTVEINEIDVATDKAALCELIDTGLKHTLTKDKLLNTSAQAWKLTPRGGLRKIDK